MANSHPQVVAMIQKNHSAQSKERILLITNLILTFYGASQQAPDEVTLQGEEYDEWDEHADERASRKQVPILTSIADDGCQVHGHHAHVRIGSKNDQCDKVIIPNP